MTRNQKAIIEFARQNDGITKKQAVELLDKYYYSNGAFHIGNSLSAMVNSGILQRVKRGEFKLLQVPISKPVIINENQLTFFTPSVSA
jgi:hypothetical protein